MSGHALRPDRPRVLDALVDGAGVRRHAVIEASAGTGKTHALEHLVLDLLLEGTPLHRILVVTFTEKATLEMRARIRSRIASLVAAGAPLRDALLDFDRASISTIHAFCQRVLSEQAFASARLFDQERLDGRAAFGRAFRDVLREQLAARSPRRPLLEGALAVMRPPAIEQTLWRWSIERGEVRPPIDLEAIAQALATMPDPAELEGSIGRAILQAIAHPAVRARAREILANLAPLVTAVRARPSLDALWPALFAWGGARPHKRAQPAAEYLAVALSGHPSLGPPAVALATATSSPLPILIEQVLPAIAARVREHKQRLGHYDFDDMLSSLAAALEGEQGEPLVRLLRSRYACALIDEFQDTDPVQWSIFRRIFFEGGGEHRLCVIGDPKQSIYGFRSADVHTYLEACEEITARGGVRAPLIESYRSTAPLIDAVHAIITGPYFTGANRYEHPVRCGRPELRATDPEGAPAPPLVLFHLIGRDRLRAKPMRASLAAAIATEIEALLGGALRVSHELRPIRASEIFVLTRTSKEGLEVASALSARGIAHAFFRQEGLFQSHEASDVLDVLSALADPSSRARRLRALLTPFFGLPLDDLGASRTLPPEHPFLVRLARWSDLAERGRFALLFSDMIGASGLSRRLLFARESERALVNYQHVLELLLVRASRSRWTVRELVEELRGLIEGTRAGEDDEDIQRLPSERAAVQLLTMHKSKGLEAEVVFLFGGLSERPESAAEPRIYHEHTAGGAQRIAWLGPAPEPIEQAIAAEQRQEHERLLYVALTRARSRLYLPYIGDPPAGIALGAEQSSDFPRLTGSYRVVNERLAALAADGAMFTERGGALIERRPVAVAGSPQRIELPAPLAPLSGETEIVAPPPLGPEQYRRLAALAKGIAVTSYSRLKQLRAAEARDVTPDEPLLETVEVSAPAEDDELPAGAAFGVFIHQLLEKIDFELVLSTPSAVELLAHAEVRALFDRAADESGIERSAIEPSAALVMRALKTPVRAGDLAIEAGFGSLTRRAAELAFLHPIPEREHPPLGASPGTRLAIERGHVRGVIDLLFEHQGKHWVLDWKTDRLSSYDSRAIEAHAAQHYDVQARLYSLAAARMLRIDRDEEHARRFGGVVYVFLRGLRARARGTEGVLVQRPSFATLRDWDRSLRESAHAWGHPLPPARARP